MKKKGSNFTQRRRNVKNGTRRAKRRQEKYTNIIFFGDFLILLNLSFLPNLTFSPPKNKGKLWVPYLSLNDF